MANGNESFLATIFGRWTVYGRWTVDVDWVLIRSSGYVAFFFFYGRLGGDRRGIVWNYRLGQIWN